MPSKSLTSTSAYQKLFKDICALHDAAVVDISRATGGILKKMGWEIGKRIVEVEQKGELHAEYGSHLLQKLSEDLSKTNRKGFSVVNLKNMRRVYMAFPIGQKPARLTWSHYVVLSSIKDDRQRKNYEKNAEKHAWTLEELKDEIGRAHV